MAEAETQSASSGGDTIEMVRFTVRGRPYVIEVSEVDSVEAMKPPTRVPRAADSIVGTIDIRGDIVTIIDPAVSLNIDSEAAGDEEDARLIMLDPGVDNQRIALHVESMDGVEAFSADAFAASSTLDVDAEKVPLDMLTGVLRPKGVTNEDGEAVAPENVTESQMIGLIDLQALIDDARREI